MSVKVLDQTQARMKAAPKTEVGQRTLDFYAATFSDTPDKNGDVIDPRACDGWLRTFYKMGKPLPISFSHAAVRNDLNPFEIIGYAPADPDHVWTDDFGLRVKAFLDVETNPTAKQVAALIDRGIVANASIAFIAVREKRQSDGVARITQMEILEAGPCVTPANEEAVVLSLKTMSDQGDETPEPETTDAPEPETTEVENVETTEVETTEIEEEKTGLTPEERQTVIEALAVSMETKHGAAPGYIQTAHDALVRSGAKCSEANIVAKTSAEDIAIRARALRLMRQSLT